MVDKALQAEPDLESLNAILAPVSEKVFGTQASLRLVDP